MAKHRIYTTSVASQQPPAPQGVDRRRGRSDRDAHHDAAWIVRAQGPDRGQRRDAGGHAVVDHDDVPPTNVCRPPPAAVATDATFELGLLEPADASSCSVVMPSRAIKSSLSSRMPSAMAPSRARSALARPACER